MVLRTPNVAGAEGVGHPLAQQAPVLVVHAVPQQVGLPAAGARQLRRGGWGKDGAHLACDT